MDHINKTKWLNVIVLWLNIHCRRKLQFGIQLITFLSTFFKCRKWNGLLIILTAKYLKWFLLLFPFHNQFWFADKEFNSSKWQSILKGRKPPPALGWASEKQLINSNRNPSHVFSSFNGQKESRALVAKIYPCSFFIYGELIISKSLNFISPAEWYSF